MREDERCTGDDGRARADGRHVGGFDLAGAGAVRCQQAALDGLPEFVDAAGAEVLRCCQRC